MIAVCLLGWRLSSTLLGPVRAADAGIGAASGEESLSEAPHGIRDVCKGARSDALKSIATMKQDGLIDAIERFSLGLSTEVGYSECNIARLQKDEFAARSRQRLAVARDVLAEEIAPHIISARHGERVARTDDGGASENVARCALEVFTRSHRWRHDSGRDSSRLTEVAAAGVVMSESVAEKRGASLFLARVVSTATVAVSASSFMCSRATRL